MYAWVHQSGRMWYGYMYSLLLLFICTVVKIINICFRWGNRTSYYGDMFIKDNEEVNEQICGIYRKGEKEVIIYILYILYSTVLYKMWLCQYFYVGKLFSCIVVLVFLVNYFTFKVLQYHWSVTCESVFVGLCGKKDKESDKKSS